MRAAPWLLACATTVLLSACGDGAAGPTPAAQSAAQPALAAATQPQAQLLTANVMFEWAQERYYDLFPVAWTDILDFTSTVQHGYIYRHYVRTGNYLGFRNEDIYVHGPVSARHLTHVGSMAQYACAVNANACTRAAETGEVMFAVDLYKRSVLRFGSATPSAGQALFGTTLQASVALGEHLAYDSSSDRLFVTTEAADILVVDSASAAASGSLVPTRSMRLSGFYSIAGLFLDRVTDRMYVLGQRNTEAGIAVVENVSTRSGTIVPDRVMTFSRSGTEMTVDLARRTAYVARVTFDGPNGRLTIAAFSNIDTASGEVAPEREFPHPLGALGAGYIQTEGLAVDSARDRLYVGVHHEVWPSPRTGKLYAVDSASTASTSVMPSATVTLDHPISHLALEPATDRLIIGLYKDYYFLESASTLQNTLPSETILLKGHSNLVLGPPVTAQTQ